VKIFSPYFRLPPIGKAPQSLRDSSPQGSERQQMQLLATAPSREKANQPDPQVWLGCYITKYHFL